MSPPRPRLVRVIEWSCEATQHLKEDNRHLGIVRVTPGRFGYHVLRCSLGRDLLVCREEALPERVAAREAVERGPRSAESLLEKSLTHEPILTHVRFQLKLIGPNARGPVHFTMS